MPWHFGREKGIVNLNLNYIVCVINVCNQCWNKFLVCCNWFSLCSLLTGENGLGVLVKWGECLVFQYCVVAAVSLYKWLLWVAWYLAPLSFQMSPCFLSSSCRILSDRMLESFHRSNEFHFAVFWSNQC